MFFLCFHLYQVMFFMYQLVLVFYVFFFFFSSRRRHTRCREVSWARRCVQETGTWVCNSSYKVSVNQKGHCSNGEAHTPKYDWSKNPDVLKCEIQFSTYHICLLYTSDAADDTPCVDLGGRRIIKKKKIRKLL
eukprot:TRINITY_DN12247_c0_g1_i2.p1 TRINITY_DN12247_c0_g1~~TRINITY_DN12247_c0_g1_i2.p1  ORF type:complete len:133 (+),score=42.33 TRINITY_DN12247_c0_g1_i2:19-417(+)